MSPDDPNSSGLNTKPDFSSVPLPEPSPIKSPYAPVGGTLGDVADDISQNDTNSANPPAPIESKSQSSEIPAAEKTNKKESDAQEPPVETKIKDKKRLKFPKKFSVSGNYSYLRSMKNLATRRTIRQYSEKEVSEELLNRLMTEASRTQTMGN